MSVERDERNNGSVVWRVRWRQGGRNRSKVLGRKGDAEEQRLPSPLPHTDEEAPRGQARQVRNPMARHRGGLQPPHAGSADA